MKSDARCYGCHSPEPSTYSHHGEMLCEACDALDDGQLASLRAERHAIALLHRCGRIPRVLALLMNMRA